LHIESTLRKLGQQHVELAITHQRLTADERHVQRLEPIDDVDNAVDQRLALSIRERPQRLAAAEMVVAVRVASRTTERAFPRDFDGEIRAESGKDFAPGSDDAFHTPNLAQKGWVRLEADPCVMQITSMRRT